MACFKNGLEELSELLRKMHVCLKEGIFGPKNTKQKISQNLFIRFFRNYMRFFIFYDLLINKNRGVGRVEM